MYFSYFTWDSNKFPDSQAMVANLTAKGRKLVTIVDPHIKRDEGYKIYKQIKDKDMYIKDRDDREFDGWCWPGKSPCPISLVSAKKYCVGVCAQMSVYNMFLYYNEVGERRTKGTCTQCKSSLGIVGH